MKNSGTDDIVIYFSEFVKKTIKEKKIKVFDLNIGVSRATIYNSRFGHTPTLISAHRILAALGTNFTEFEKYLKGATDVE